MYTNISFTNSSSKNKTRFPFSYYDTYTYVQIVLVLYFIVYHIVIFTHMAKLS